MIVEVSTLASHMALSHEGHLFAVYHVFSYVNCSKNSCLVIDANYPDIEKCIIAIHNWNEFYDDV